MDLTFTAEEQAFRAEVRTWLAANLPKDIRQRSLTMPSYVGREMTQTWTRILYDKGWVAPGWPKEYGGTGWSPAERHLFEEEYQAANCPRLSPFGLTMVGPVLYTFGTDAQKQRFLQPILSGAEFWCQGYSEPGAGSDLASLKTRARRDGEHYRVNGHKIWTSHAHHADWMFCLVRTDVDTKPQAGISFLLIDMKSPGVTIKPIITIDGNHYLNEVFLDDVSVPLENRVGEENKGWTYAKFLLGHERTGLAGISKSKEKIARLKALAAATPDADGSLLDDGYFRRRLAEIEITLMGLEVTNLRILARSVRGDRPGPETSTLKIMGTQIEQDLNELLVQALGYYAAPYDYEWLRAGANVTPIGPPEGEGLMAEHLLRRASSIYGGSNEIQKGILAKLVLEM